MVKPIKAAGGVVYRIKNDKLQVLLIFRNGTWDLPKGKLEKGESIPMCAVREVSEETNSALPIIVSDLGTTYHEYREKKKHFGKTTYWYSMIYGSDQSFIPQSEEGIEDIEWRDLEIAIQEVGYQNLVDVLNRFKEDFGQ